MGESEKVPKPDYVKFEWPRTEFHIQILIWIFLHYALRIIENISWNCSHSKLQSRVHEVLNNILLCTNMTFYLKTKQCVVQGKIYIKNEKHFYLHLETLKILNSSRSGLVTILLSTDENYVHEYILPKFKCIVTVK